mgnify:FL=1
MLSPLVFRSYMNFERTYKELCQLGIPKESYYLNGLFGSTSDNERLALTARRGKYTIEYETYFKERGEKGSMRTFTNQDEASNYFITELFNKLLSERISSTDVSGATGNERLHLTGLIDLFDQLKRTNKTRATQLVVALGFDKSSIEQLLK